MSDFEAIQNRRNLVVGVFVMVGFLAFGWLIFKFGDMPLWVAKLRSYDVHVQFSSADGVQKDTPVRFCGYQIGRVTFVEPPRVRAEILSNSDREPRWFHQSMVTMSIDNQFDDIPKDSQVKLLTRGLGSSFIEIKAPIPGEKDEEVELLVHGATLQGSTGISSDFFPEETQKKLEALVDDLRTFVGNANDIAGDDENKENLKTFLGNLTEASEQAARTLEEAYAAIGDYRVLAGAGKNAVDKVSASIVVASEELSKASSQLNVMLAGINEGDGTIGKLVNDARLYEELLDTSTQMQILVTDLKSLIQAINDRGLMRVLKKGTK
ncbi:MAG: MCE family protein [Phycisphaeraceae bacterium]|nr:MCE family protein [Phycisphaeraceae bacterium]